ncbi:MAG: sphingosine/diacylglycerol kinaselike enzyme [Planctomycetota bacterium]|nr:sphingosine/diacylglycerol kinaselike enzyme [Planctomycetota bacterium]
MVAESADDPSCRCLVAAGGDGTVASLINEQPSRPITVLRAGTENLFARHFHMKQSPEEVAETIALGRVEAIDLGQTGERRFVLMAGIGFDAEVVCRHHASRMGKAGLMRPTSRSAYVEPVLRASFGYKFPALRMVVDDREELVGTTAFIFNLPRYALGLPFAPTARGDDGLLDLIVFRDAGPFRALHYLWMVFRGLHLRRDGVYHRRVSRVSVSATESVPVQLDGDPGGVVEADRLAVPWTVDVLPSAIAVMVPKSYESAAAIA